MEARDFGRWVISIAAVIAAHAGLAAALAHWGDETEAGEPPAAIVLELAPLPVAPSDAQEDVPLEPEQLQEETPEEKPEEMVEEKVEEKLEPEPDPPTEVAVVVPPPPKNVGEPKPKKPPTSAAAPRAIPKQQTAKLAAAPAQGQPTHNSNAIPSWKRQLVSILERNKRYPPQARSRNEQGVAQLAFSINREGQLSSAHILRSSGSSTLDAETVALVRRIGSFPPPPAEFPGVQVSLTVPIRYNIR
jgi:protein TonB